MSKRLIGWVGFVWAASLLLPWYAFAQATAPAVPAPAAVSAPATPAAPNAAEPKKDAAAGSPVAGLPAVLNGEITPEEVAALDAPEPPPLLTGFKNNQELMAAVIQGKLHILSPYMTIPVPEGVTEYLDIEYGKVGDRVLQLNLYVPDGLKEPAPTLVFIHGGGWQSGNRTDYKYYCVRYAKRGYVCATISYRFAAEAPFPACVQDAKCAVRWMRANAAKYNIDPNRIGAIGGSAGGHLSMMVGYSSDVAELEGDGGNPGVSSAVQVVVDYYGPTEFTIDLPERNHPTLKGLFGGKSYEEVPDQYKQASPMQHLDPKDPPTMILHGTIDDLVPVWQSDMLEEQLTKLGIPHEYVKLDGYPHAMDLGKEVNLYCQWHVLRFLDKYLKNAPKAKNN